MKQDEAEKIVKAGKIVQEAVAYAKSIVKPGMKLIDIADKIEAKIVELGGKPAFPVNLSINEIAAHATPAWNESEIAKGLLKADIGVHIEGYVADTAISFDLENSKENKILIETAHKALENALVKALEDQSLHEIGDSIQKTAEEKGFTPVVNLCGHQIRHYDLHAGFTIPNYGNNSPLVLKEGLYAIEPFVTSGVGRVRDGKPSGIYHLTGEGNVRDNFAREVLEFIHEEYGTLPFCSRWIYRKFGARGLLALRQIEQAGIVYQYAQLVEESGKAVAQAEHTVLVLKDKKIVTTRD